MKTKIARELIRELPLCLADVARLALEGAELLGERAEGLRRSELMQLLRRVLHAGVEAVQVAEHTVSFEEAAWASIEARKGRRAATLRDLRHFVRRLLRVPGVGERPLRAMTTQECRAALDAAFGGSAHSYRKGRAILHSIFAYGYRREWCDVNPVDRIETPCVQEREIVPLGADQVGQLVRAAELPQHAAMRLSLHLMVFCGVRPAEVQKLDPLTDIDWQGERVIIRPMRSKTGGGRVVPLRGAAQLRRLNCPLDIPRNWALRWKRLRLAAHLPVWRPDALRHTFASYHAAYYRNLPALQLEMGHRDVGLLQTRYLNPLHTPPREAQRFWRLTGE